MIITHHGKHFFKLQFGDTVIAVNPPSSPGKEKVTKFGSDIVVVSADHESCNGIDLAEYGERKPFVIDGPGSYELKGVSIVGALTWPEVGGVKIPNTMYMIHADDLAIAVLGLQDSKADIPAEVFETLGDADIVLTPVSSPKAYQLALALTPFIVIPSGFDDPKSKEVETFKKEVNGSDVETLDKFTVKKRDLNFEGTQVVVLNT